MTSHDMILALDTCGIAATVALLRLQDRAGGALVSAGSATLAARNASAELLPAIRHLLDEAQCTLATLRGLVVVNGPGSFTGVRVGLSSAKGLAHACQVPLFAISRLAVLGCGHPGGVSLLDAGRGEYYARYADREWLASAEEMDTLSSAGRLLVAAESQVIERFASAHLAVVHNLDAGTAAHAVLPRLLSGQSDAVEQVDANYLRRSDAELFARTPSVPER